MQHNDCNPGFSDSAAEVIQCTQVLSLLVLTIKRVNDFFLVFSNLQIQ